MKYKFFFYGIIIAAFVIILDQYTKITVIDYFNNIATTNIIKITPFFDIILVWNRGISFGMFSNMKHSAQFFLVISSLITVFLIFWLAKAKNFATYFALGFVIGGAVGNIIDRVMYNAVADFIDIHVNGYYWPTFNIADACISIGVVILLIESILEERREKNK